MPASDDDAGCAGACTAHTAGRRALLTAGMGIGLAMAAQPSQAQPKPEPDTESHAAKMRPQEGDLLVRADSTDLSPLTPMSLEPGGGPVLALPFDPQARIARSGSRLNRILLLRLDPAVLNAVTAQRAVDGVVAYSAICPHTGCEVTGWHSDSQILECPCHNSQYDPKAGARLIAGPSPRGLAALPLRIAEGNLAVAHVFIGKLGMQQM